jgi:hypothetical protein
MFDCHNGSDLKDDGNATSAGDVMPLVGVLDHVSAQRPTFGARYAGGEIVDFLHRPDTAAVDAAIVRVMQPRADLATDAADARLASVMAWRLFLVGSGWHNSLP